MKRLPFAAIAVFFSTVSGYALAEPPSTVTTNDYVDQGETGDRVVTFRDDSLATDGKSIFGVSMRRPPGIVRVGLIRPRVNFVAELLKSVENL